MERKINISIYITAFIIASILFLLGIFIGWQIAFSAISQIKDEYEKLRVSDYALEVMFLMNYSDEFVCELYKEQLNKFGEEAIEFGKKIDFMENQKGKMDSEVMRFKASYNLLQLRNYLLLEKTQKKCNATHTILLYFYSNENYDARVDQGIIIDQIRSKINITVYAFDIHVDSPPVKMFIRMQNVTRVPAIIVNNKKYEGYMDREKLLNILHTSAKE
ncbi:MAG: hypothetical protein AB1391_00705 [Candidatus Micrarchaeota archaeon]